MAKTPPAPLYWGGMILSDDLEAVYNYEEWLVHMLEHRFRRYEQKWQLFIGVVELARQRKYAPTDRHVMPGDPLVPMSDDVEAFCDVLSLKRKHLVMLEFECFKYARRKGYFPRLERYI